MQCPRKHSATYPCSAGWSRGPPPPQYMHNLACKQYKRGDFLHITPSSHQMASPPSITRTQYHLHQLLQHKSILNYNTSVVYDISLLLVKYHHKQYFITSRFSDSITHGTLGIKHHEGNATILVPNGNTQNLSSKLKKKWNEANRIHMHKCIKDGSKVFSRLFTINYPHA